MKYFVNIAQDFGLTYLRGAINEQSFDFYGI